MPVGPEPSGPRLGSIAHAEVVNIYWGAVVEEWSALLAEIWAMLSAGPQFHLATLSVRPNSIRFPSAQKLKNCEAV